MEHLCTIMFNKYAISVLIGKAKHKAKRKANLELIK